MPLQYTTEGSSESTEAVHWVRGPWSSYSAEHFQILDHCQLPNPAKTETGQNTNTYNL